MSSPISLKGNVDIKRSDSTITIDYNVFPLETNKVTTVGRIRPKKFLVQCTGDGHMKFNVIKDPIELLKELAKLRKSCIITEEEFENKKKELLEDI